LIVLDPYFLTFLRIWLTCKILYSTDNESLHDQPDRNMAAGKFNDAMIKNFPVFCNNSGANGGNFHGQLFPLINVQRIEMMSVSIYGNCFGKIAKRLS